MSYTERFTEKIETLEQSLVPLTRGANTYITAYVSLTNHPRAIFDLYVGAIAQGATINAQVYQATTVAGAGAKIVLGKAITQLTVADTNCGHVYIELRTEELDVPGLFDCVALQVVVAGGNTTWGVTILGDADPRYQPVSTAILQEIVP